MYEEKSKIYSDIKFLNIKIFQKIQETSEFFDHKYKDNEEEQPILDRKIKITIKLLNIPIFIISSYSNDNNTLIKKNKFNFKLPPLKKSIKIIFALFGIFLLLISAFISGIYFSDSVWLNDTFYIKSKQMRNLEIKSLKPYNTALFKKAETQYEMNNASYERYEHYHKYYEKVVDRIKNMDIWPEYGKAAILDYINGYEGRKAQMDYMMFPCKDKPLDDCGYGTIFGSMYPDSMLEFDRNELMTYRMILSNMYTASIYRDELENIFEE